MFSRRLLISSIDYSKIVSPKKQPLKLYKKGATKSGSPTQDGQGEKVVKSRWQPRNGCDGRSMAKNFNNNKSGQSVSLSQLH